MTEPMAEALRSRALEDLLADIAAWIVVLHGDRINVLSIQPDGFWSGDETTFCGIVLHVGRGPGEGRQSLPGRALRDLAEAAFLRARPDLRFDGGGWGRDCRRAASTPC